MAIHS